jgi:hypothetical protein
MGPPPEPAVRRSAVMSLLSEENRTLGGQCQYVALDPQRTFSESAGAFAKCHMGRGYRTASALAPATVVNMARAIMTGSIARELNSA